MCTRDKVLQHLYYNDFMINYYVWRMHGEDDSFIQVENDIPSFNTFENLVAYSEIYL